MIFTDVTCRNSCIFWTLGDVSHTVRDGTTPRDGNTSISSPRLNYPVLIGAGNTISQTRTGSQEIGSPKGPTGPVEIRNARIFHTSIQEILTKNGDSTPTFSKVIRQELSHDSSANILLCCQLNFTHNVVRTEIPSFMNFGLPALQRIHQSEK